MTSSIWLRSERSDSPWLRLASFLPTPILGLVWRDHDSNSADSHFLEVRYLQLDGEGEGLCLGAASLLMVPVFSCYPGTTTVLHFFILSPPDWQASHNGWLVLGLRPVWRSHGCSCSELQLYAQGISIPTGGSRGALEASADSLGWITENVSANLGYKSLLVLRMMYRGPVLDSPPVSVPEV